MAFTDEQRDALKSKLSFRHVRSRMSDGVAIPYLESNPHVYRYSWFSADPIPNGRLVNSDGSPTALGQVYIGLPGGCH